MRTQDEIVHRLAMIVAAKLPMDREYPILLPCLDWEHARPFLKPEATAALWDASELTPDEETLQREGAACLERAWETLTEHDVMRAARLIGNFRAYLWLLATDDDVVEYDAVPPRPYGGPRFLYVSRTLHWPAPTERAERMAAGHPCSDLCIQGCKNAELGTVLT